MYPAGVSAEVQPRHSYATVVPPLAITALGLATPLGIGAEASCAALRATLSRFVAIETAALAGDDGQPVRLVVSSVRGVTDGLDGVERLAELAALALRDLLASARLSDREADAAPLHLALAEPRADARAVIVSELTERLERSVGLLGLGERTSPYPAGHAGAIAALEQAAAAVRSGAAPRAIVGGVDSLLAPDVVQALHAEGRLKAGERPVGVMPGEAAAFVLVEPAPAAEARGAAPLATVAGVATSRETATIRDEDAVCHGAGLSDAMARALASLPGSGEGLGLIVCDLNGEPYRSEELAYAATKVLGGVQAPFRLWHAADSIGDVGAASAAVSLAVAARALHRGYARCDEALVVASSDGGLRGAAALRTAGRPAEPSSR